LKRHTRLTALIALASCLGASACGSLLGLGDLPALDGGAGSALDGEAIVVESGSASEGGPTDGAPAEGAGGDSPDAYAPDASAEASAPEASSPEAGPPMYGQDGGPCVLGATWCRQFGDASPGACSTTETGWLLTCEYTAGTTSLYWDSTAGACCGGVADAGTGEDVEAPDAAADVCTPTATQCTSDTQVETCGSDGQWGAPTTCSYVCTGGACGGVCTQGAMQCSGESVETCSSDGQWETTTTCSGGMTCSMTLGTAACACPSGEVNCSGTCETSCPETCTGGLYWCAERNECTTAANCN
jgi:hypothetical protein